MRRILTDKSGEGYLNTAVKIIIAVVLGGIILAGVYALFTNVILPKTDTKIEAMMNTGSDIQVRKGIKSVEYSYDGTTWKPCTVAGTDGTATVTNMFSLGTGEQTVYLASYKTATGGAVYSSRNGLEWTPVYTDATSVSISKGSTYAYVNCNDGRSYRSTDGVNWTMTSTKRY